MADEWKTRITSVRPPQVGSQAACLVLIYPPGAQMGKRFPLEASEQYIGRGNDCEIMVDMDSVSRRHARIEQKGAATLITDMESTNGTYVNEHPVTQARALADGDLVQVGNAIFKFLSGGNVESSYHEAIYRMTIIDGLTEAHNKRYLFDYLERELARCQRYGRPLSVVIFDLDHFKQVNDTHGHLTGDAVLRELARRLRSRIRREELLARYGGEEFVVVLPEAGHAGAMRFAEQLRELVGSQPFEFEGEVIPLTVSVGVATLEGEPMEVSPFIKMADENLYRAKRAGRNRVVG
ncbi:MAG: GGDEF domain-containing protein [Deltaproteobacteria bacterium]|nr:GGDEF domain-containing protein [Deltaproteobacteria bacterium]